MTLKHQDSCKDMYIEKILCCQQVKLQQNPTGLTPAFSVNL